MDIEESGLCQFCSDLIDATNDTVEKTSHRPHHATYGLLLSSSKTCAVCQFMLTSLWSHVTSTLMRYGLSHETIESSQQGFKVNVTMKESRRMQSGVRWAFLETSLATTNTPLTFINHFTITSSPSTDPPSSLPVWKAKATSFDEKLATIRAWLHDCTTRDGHTMCRPVSHIPFRLLTTGLDGSALRLVRGTSATNSTEYAALTYCWGQSLQLRTTKATLPRFSKEVPQNLIPRTWSDAIHMARALQIPHIWIDALCIVQDDEMEWQREVEHMSEIYQGSQLTIAAVDSSDSSQGCFPSDADGFKNGELFFRTRPDKANRRSSLVRVYRNDIRNRAGGGTAISKRGWTLQEQLLSPRLVHCMRSQVHWQCRANYQTQDGLSFELAEALQGNNMLIPGPNLHSHQEYRSAWRRIIDGYSLREFSYPRDRIPAIAGISRYFCSVLGDVSILGLWKKSFAQDLAWLRGRGPPQMSDTAGLPSWTWLTCQGCVLYTMGDKYDREMEVVESLELTDWNVQWQGVPFTSPVKSAEVRVKGPVREIRIVPCAEGNRHIPPYFQVFEENSQRTSERQIPWRCAGRFDAGDPSKAATYMCLHLFSEPRSSESDRMREVFLILELVGMENGMKYYKRVGLARIWGDSPTFDPSITMSMVLV